MPSDTPLYEICKANVWRGNTCVFRGLNLTVAEQESLAILGPNGSGKTTLVQLLTRALRPEFSTDGHVKIRGRTLENVNELRRHLGYVSHDLHLDAWQSVVGQDVILSGFSASVGLRGVPFRVTEYQRDAMERVSHALEISDLLGRPFGQLSTGQQRQLLLARALVLQPAAVVFDEPTAGLDLRWSALYLDRLRQLIRQGVSLTLVTHEVHEVPPEIRRIVFVKRGQIVADDDRAVLLQDEPLSELFELPVLVTHHEDGFCSVATHRD